MSANRTRPTPPGPNQPGSVFVEAERRSAVVPASAFTLAGFRQWLRSEEFPEDARVLFLDGEVHLDMSKEELESHNKVKTEVARVLLNLTRERDLGEVYGDGARITNLAASVSNNPDAVFVSWESLDAGRARLVSREGEQTQFLEIEGTPDWVLEVVSDSSVKKDTQRLRQAYHRAGIEEYWLIDARGQEVVFQILVRRRTRYVPAPSQEGWQRSPTFRRSFRLERVQGRRGLWRYTLHERG